MSASASSRRERYTRAFSHGLKACHAEVGGSGRSGREIFSSFHDRFHVFLILILFSCFLTYVGNFLRRMLEKGHPRCKTTVPLFARSCALIFSALPPIIKRNRPPSSPVSASLFRLNIPTRLQIEQGICETEFRRLKSCWRTALKAALRSSRPS
jgi:hypothetical protein